MLVCQCAAPRQRMDGCHVRVGYQVCSTHMGVEPMIIFLQYCNRIRVDSAPYYWSFWFEDFEKGIGPGSEWGGS